MESNQPHLSHPTRSSSARRVKLVHLDLMRPLVVVKDSRNMPLRMSRPDALAGASTASSVATTASLTDRLLKTCKTVGLPLSPEDCTSPTVLSTDRPSNKRAVVRSSMSSDRVTQVFVLSGRKVGFRKPPLPTTPHEKTPKFLADYFHDRTMIAKKYDAMIQRLAEEEAADIALAVRKFEEHKEGKDLAGIIEGIQKEYAMTKTLLAEQRIMEEGENVSRHKNSCS